MLAIKHTFKPLLMYEHKACLTTLSEKQEIKRKERDARHYAPANKEWKNSVYLFNKSNLSKVTAKDKIAAKMIKTYFSMVPKSIKIIRSKRMRDLLRRYSITKLFVSKPEIKQNNNKAIITIYTYDREKVSFLKKLYMLNRWLNTKLLDGELNKSLLIKEGKESNRYLINKYNVDHLHSTGIFNKFRRVKYGNTSNILRMSFPKYKANNIFIKKIIASLLKKKQYISSMVYHYFLKWAFSIFNVKISIIPNIKSIIKENKEVQKIAVVDLVLTKLKKAKKRKNKGTIFTKKITLNGNFNFKTLHTINTLLLQHLISNFHITLNTNQKINGLFVLFRKNHFDTIARKLLKKEILIIKYLTKLYTNKFKSYNYLPGIKSLLTNIYDKKIQLNIVNLKYLHLNSELFTEAIAIKLKDRTKSMGKILRSSFTMVRTFKPNEMFLLSEKKKNFSVTNMKTYFGEYNVINGNVLSIAFREMFKNKSIKKPIRGLNTSITDVLTSLKYKWVTGIRLEAAGRLTSRYAAARALFKYKYRGTLKNLEHLKNIENKLQSPSLFLLRGENRPNVQYTFATDKRRIGAFGIKSWISSS